MKYATTAPKAPFVPAAAPRSTPRAHHLLTLAAPWLPPAPRVGAVACDDRADGDAAADPVRAASVVLLADALHRAPDAWTLLEQLRRRMAPTARLLVSWDAPPRLVRGGRAAAGRAAFERDDVANLLALTGFRVVSPRPTGVAAPAASRWLVAEPAPPAVAERDPAAVSVSVIIPCRNERGNVAAIFERTPSLGRETELVFVDGASTDGTPAAIRARSEGRSDVRLLHQGDGRGKADAVRRGFAAARGDVLMILDADLTVPPEALPRFLAAWCRRGGLVNGTRLLYPMEPGAMRRLNHVGNRLFARLLGRIADRHLTDTLCGTKVIGRADYAELVRRRDRLFGDRDPFGDFDLLLGAAHMGLPITEVPVRYAARRWGETKIHRFGDGWKLLRLAQVARRQFA